MIDGHPLLAYAVAFGRRLGVDQVILSTDSRDYADIGERYGALVPGLRSAHASRDAALTEELFFDLVEALPARGIPLPDIWIRLKPTSPFRRPASVHAALDVLKDDPSIDSVRIVSRADARLVTRNAAGFLEPLLREGWPATHSVVPRTWVPEAFTPFNLELFRHKLWEERFTGYMGDRIHPIVDHAITGLDIDDQDDLDIIKAMIEMRPRPKVVSDYLVTPE